MNLFGYNIRISKNRATPTKKVEENLPPGRVSVPDDGVNNILYLTKDYQQLVSPSFRVEVIQLIRDLYKVNPDVSKAVQDMYQLTNTGHQVQFPNNTDKEAEAMNKHLRESTKQWSNYSAGIDGLVNKMIYQLLIGGAISIEAVPNKDLNGLSTILFIKPDNIIFRRESDGVYQPYQKNPIPYANGKEYYIKLNTQTYKYIGMPNDTDEPYGVPPFMAALDSIKEQSNMRINIKHMMENMGLMGFLQALVEKPDQTANESTSRYERRLNQYLRQMKINLKDGMKDGLIVGYKDDHEFNMVSTTKDMNNIDKPWVMNEQSIANGLGINSSLIGVQASTTEGGAGVNLSKLISQLKVIQRILGFALEFIYTLELRLAGFNNKGMNITWNQATVSDDVKIQQARQYKIQNLHTLYQDGVISLFQYAQEAGYDQPDQDEPRVPLVNQSGNTDPNAQQGIDKDDRQSDKAASARRTRDKNNPSPKRKDQDSRTR